MAFPSDDEIRTAAYYRWERRGGGHGRDGEDWRAAEQSLLLAKNYRIVAFYLLDDAERRVIGQPNRRVCRFCEQSPPRTTFTDPATALPAFLGAETLFALDQCDECRASFRHGIDRDLEAFSRPFRAGTAPLGSIIPTASIPIGA